MLTAYREYKVFLNVNSVVGSPTMCARRIFEITASGTPVVSHAAAPRSARYFPADEVLVARRPAEARGTRSAPSCAAPELRDRAAHRAQRTIWREHTYGHRVAARCCTPSAWPVPHGPTTRSVTALVSTNRPHQLDHVLPTVGAQQGVDLQLVAR